MSERKAVAKGKNKKPTFIARLGSGFVRFFARIGSAFRNTWRELKKVTWPTRDKLINYSIIVMLFMLFMMVIIGLLDTGATTLVQLIMG